MKRAPSLKLNFTVVTLNALPLPEAGERVTYHDTQVIGLQLRVTSNGTKTFYVFQRVNGKPERVKVGEHPYPITGIDQARRQAKAIIHQIAEGQSPSAAKREDKAKSLTLAEAVDQYVADKRRRTDKLPLKARTVDDYLAMLKPPRLTATGKRTKGGALARLAGKSIYGIGAADIKAVHDENLKCHSRRQAFYAMQTLKAILHFYAVKIPQDPFSTETPEAGRIYIEPAGVSETEPVEHLLNHLGEWWRALHALPPSPVTDYLAFLLLTGCRPGEPLKVLAGDLVNGEIKLIDTKNRSSHLLLLSTQALAIAQRNAAGKVATEPLFNVTPAQANALAHELSATTGIPFVPKMLRSLFASIADELTSASTLKRLMNHKQKSDITDTNYIRKLKETLREAWQKISDFIEAIASDNVVPIRGAAS
ncbi:integrase family protein [Pseudomonas sp. LS1212]|uniref:tyrosine-type recombinase/integrase n=1 Tax=Pseudomonas sp. LS1212 TaxID=2972478 RepID=UPI00215C1EB2|nr:integrase family protein [Pseudomonas sp. LS1212]UVJ44987.1 integrase family protein [Pseudomonas sp. LS1212]